MGPHMTIRPRRSVLYMPGSNARALEKAKTLPADGVILDLEDSVAPDAKEEARRQVIDAVKAGGFGAREVIFRINAVETPWHADDLAAADGYACADLDPGLGDDRNAAGHLQYPVDCRRGARFRSAAVVLRARHQRSGQGHAGAAGAGL